MERPRGVQPPPATEPDAPDPADPDRPARIVTPDDAPNPFVLIEGDDHFLYHSKTGPYAANIALRTSDRLTVWGEPVDVLPDLPPWTEWGFTWAPDVRRFGASYVLYFTSRLAGTADPPIQCIGAATAPAPDVAFDPQPEPIVCQTERLGSIDPRTFTDRDGTVWLHWKSDDNADVDGTTTTTIYAQRLAADGLSLVGEPVRILEADQPWEGRIVEAPDMELDDRGRYWLFYSGNWFNQPAYAIGVARCEGPAGPCTKPFDGPWLASNDQGAGPGEASLVTDAGGATWILYSPRAQEFETIVDRPVAMARVAFGPDGPYLAR
jgi:beta-xylosidase